METDEITRRYKRRRDQIEPNRYSVLRTEVTKALFERNERVIRLLARYHPQGLGNLKLVEVGCGTGGNLLDFIRWGFSVHHLKGLELLPERALQARMVLPEGIVFEGDARLAKIDAESQDIVFQSVVFSSILDAAFQADLAQTMWKWVKPGGAVLWYDFVVNNPRNPDVRKVGIEQVKRLFPEGRLRYQRVTLAPPLARLLCRIHPALYDVFNCLPWLRTHVLCWIEKKNDHD